MLVITMRRPSDAAAAPQPAPRRSVRWTDVVFWLLCGLLIAAIATVLLTEGTYDGVRDVVDVVIWW